MSSMSSLYPTSRVIALVALLGVLSGGLPVRADLESAGEVFVDLDAGDLAAGLEVWPNRGSLGDFEAQGSPLRTRRGGAPAVMLGFTTGVYLSRDDVSAGLIGLDSTRSIEVWVFNSSVSGNERLVAWGLPGGPSGTNMAFGYGANPSWGAVGHWGIPDLGWARVPTAGQWHHLVYTYDGWTTCVYSDGALNNFEELGPGAINTDDANKILIGGRYTEENKFYSLTTVLIGRIRIHDGVLTPEQVRHNHEKGRAHFPFIPRPPIFFDPPAHDFMFKVSSVYATRLYVEGFPRPTLEVIEPQEAVISESGDLTCGLPLTVADSFKITVRARNDSGTQEATWRVTRMDLPRPGKILTAGELFVNLDAGHMSAGTKIWENQGTLKGFQRIGLPTPTTVNGAPAISFNNGSTRTGDAYQSIDDVPDGLIGLDSTRSIEVWVINPTVGSTEPMVSWGARDGTDGNAVSFNYGAGSRQGAVFHGGFANLGWRGGGDDNKKEFPARDQWHHLVFTYDGVTTRVWCDGALVNHERVGRGVINTDVITKILIAHRSTANGITLPYGGSLLIGKIRIHDGSLTPFQVRNNYYAEKEQFLGKNDPQLPEPQTKF